MIWTTPLPLRRICLGRSLIPGMALHNQPQSHQHHQGLRRSRRPEPAHPPADLRFGVRRFGHFISLRRGTGILPVQLLHFSHGFHDAFHQVASPPAGQFRNDRANILPRAGGLVAKHRPRPDPRPRWLQRRLVAWPVPMEIMVTAILVQNCPVGKRPPRVTLLHHAGLLPHTDFVSSSGRQYPPHFTPWPPPVWSPTSAPQAAPRSKPAASTPC